MADLNTITQNLDNDLKTMQTILNDFYDEPLQQADYTYDLPNGKTYINGDGLCGTMIYDKQFNVWRPCGLKEAETTTDACPIHQDKNVVTAFNLNNANFGNERQDIKYNYDNVYNLAEYQEKFGNQRSSINNLISTRDKLRTAIIATGRYIGDQQQNQTNLDNRIQELENELKKCYANNKSENEVVEDLRLQLQKAQEELQRLRQQSSDQKDNLRSREQEIQRLNGRIRELENELEQCTNSSMIQTENDQKTTQGLRNEILTLKQQLQDSKKIQAKLEEKEGQLLDCRMTVVSALSSVRKNNSSVVKLEDEQKEQEDFGDERRMGR